MAVYTTFFLCEPDRLLEAFPGAKLPLDEPRPITMINPFTGERVGALTREPDWIGVDATPIAWEGTEIRGVAGRYARYLEWRLPTFIRSVPHWCSKNLLHTELEPLMAVSTGSDELRLDAPFYMHPTFLLSVDRFPDSFVHALGEADDETLLEMAKKWSASLSTTSNTHSANRQRIRNDWCAMDALSVLRPIAGLAKQAREGQAMYILTEV